MAARRSSGASVASAAVDDETSDGFWGDEFPAVARRLLTSAVACFARSGFHATTTRDITAALSLSPGALYVHFSSKEEVLFAIMRTGHQRVLETLTAPGGMPQNEDAAEVLAELVRRLVVWHARYHTVARVCQYELSGLSPEHYQYVLGQRQASTAVFHAAVQAGVSAGVFDAGDITRVVRALVSLGVDLVRWYRLDGTDSPEDLADAYAVLALRMLGAGRPADAIPQRSSPSGPRRRPRQSARSTADDDRLGQK
jgi:AcrR family transcriptional regulator